MKSLKPFAAKNIINVIIETPKGCRNKFAYEPESGCFELSKVLPAGTSFPLEFCFIPGTKAEDGDPLDVMVIVETECFPGCLLKCRVIGVIEAKQKEKGKDEERNDRILAVSTCSIDHSELKHVNEMNKNLLDELIHFFEYYNKMRGKKYNVIGTRGPGHAIKLVKKHVTTSAK